MRQINGSSLVLRQIAAGTYHEIPGWDHGAVGERVILAAPGGEFDRELIVELGEEFPEPHCATAVTLIANER